MICRFCSLQKEGVPFTQWVKPTFTDHDKLQPGEIVCHDCLFWFDEASQELAARAGKEKPQRMRNYSHFVVGGKWTPLSKGNKAEMKRLLLGQSFPELAVIADSGQKHLVFRAVRNPAGSRAGWVQFEEQRLWAEAETLGHQLEIIEPALSLFSKAELETGRYLPHRILAYGLENWQALEVELKPLRGGLLLKLVIFLAQKQEDEHAGNSGGSTGDHLAGHQQRIQEPLPPDDLGAVREYGAGGGLHQQSGQVRQLDLFEVRGNDPGRDD